MNRIRVFSAIIYNGKIAMVHNIEPHRVFWTLPGGGVEDNENFEETAVREAFEEVNLKIKIIRFLYKKNYSAGIEYCYLGEPIDPENISTGYDPELGKNNQTIVKAEWREITEVKDDIQVSLVLKKLTINEKMKYKIETN
jgi:8-oxo-dGTP diphosphatase